MTYILILSNSRNIVNTDIIDKFLSDMKRLTDNNEVRNWIDKKLKKYMLDEYKIVKPFKGKSKIDDPEWLKKAISDNKATEIKLSKRFINHVTDIVKYLEKLDPHELSKIFKLSFEIVEKKFMIENDVWDNPEELKEIKRYDRGIRWVNVLGKKALEREGRLLDHCVGGYFSKVRDGESVIYSLRDGENNPECTIEINPNEHCLYQIKGYKDGPIKKEYNEYVVDFLNSYKGVLWREIKTRDLMNNTTIIEIGKNEYIDVMNIPENFTINNSLELRRACKLPNNLTINGSLLLNDYKYNELPKGLIINGDLFLDGSWITELPNDLKVSGRVSLSQSKVKRLPKEIVFKDDLDLSFTDIDILPEGLIVEGSLFLDSTKVTKIPPNVTVGGNLILVKFYPSKIVSIGNNLTVGKDLNMTSSKIKELPSNVKIGGNLYANFSKLLTLPSDIKIGGDIFLEKSSITFLPDNLTVNKNLYITRSKLKKLPKNLTVNGNLDISFTKITEIPKGLNLTVKKNFSVYGLTDGKDLKTSIKIPDDIIYKRLLYSIY